MRRFSRIALAILGLIAASIACDSPPSPYINIEKSSWSSDSKRIVFAVRDGESVNGEARVFNVTNSKNKKPISTISYANRAIWTSADRLLVGYSSAPQTFSNSDDNNLKPIQIEGESAVWSPDGTRVAYLKCYSTATCILYVADSDGQNPHQLSGSINLDYPAGTQNCQFSWSLDSNQIAFSQRHSGIFSEIKVISLETQNMSTIDQSQYNSRNVCPTWLQNGRVAFLSDRDKINPSYYDFKIYSMNSDGSDLQQLSNYEYVENIAASPDGSRIAFMTLPKSGETEGQAAHPLHSMNFDGTGHKLLRGGGGAILIWSPNGQYLTYHNALSQKITVIDSTSGAVVWEYQVSPIDYLKVDTPKYPILPALLCCIAPLVAASLRIGWFVRRRKKRRSKPAMDFIPPSFPVQPSA